MKFGFALHAVDDWVQALPAGGPTRTLNQGSSDFVGTHHLCTRFPFRSISFPLAYTQVFRHLDAPIQKEMRMHLLLYWWRRGL